MRKMTLPALCVALWLSATAFADDIVFHLSANGLSSYESSFGTGLIVSAQTTQTISDMEFFMEMPDGGDLKFMIWEAFSNNLIFLTTLSNVAPFYRGQGVSSGPINFTLQAGQIYEFGIISDVTTYLGDVYPPINYSSHGLTAPLTPGNPLYLDYNMPRFSGSYGGSQIGLRLSEVPEPGSLILIVTGILSGIGRLRRKLF